MLLMGSRTQKRLAALLVSLIQNENRIENRRIALCRQPNIDFFSLYQQIDLKKRGFFQKDEILDYLCKNNVFATTKELQFLIQLLDSDQDTVVTYDNFLNFILPKQNPDLRREALAIDKVQAARQLQEMQQQEQNQRNNINAKVQFTPQANKLSYSPQNAHLQSTCGNTTTLQLSTPGRRDPQLNTGNSFQEEKIQNEFQATLITLFEQIIHNFKSIEAKKEILHASSDFQMEVAFKTIDSSGINKLDYEGLEEFLTLNGEKVEEKDLLVLIRSFGSLNDGFITEPQFMDMILPIEFNRKKNAVQESFLKSNKISKTVTQATIKPVDPLVQPKRVGFESQPKPMERTLPIGREGSVIGQGSCISGKGSITGSQQDRISTLQRGSQAKITSGSRSVKSNNKFQYITLAKITGKKPLSRGMLSTPQSKRFDRTVYSNKMGGNQLISQGQIEDDAEELQQVTDRFRCPSMKGNEEENFVKKMHQLVVSDYKIEELKQELAIQRDFNLLDSFQFLDLDGMGSITPQELYVNLKKLNLSPTKQQIYLFYKQYDLDFSGRLEFSEFVKTFIPIEQEYRNLLNNRAATGNGFSEETKQLLKETFQAILLNSQEVEQIRQELNQRRLFNTYDAFNAIDQDSNGFITQEDFRTLFLDYDIHFSPKEIYYFFRRLDKGLDGEISYGEFLSEITPKCPFKITDQQLNSPLINNA